MEAIGEIADVLAEKLVESGVSRGGEKSHGGEKGREFPGCQTKSIEEGGKK
jgi:hypothetical protein